MGSLQANPGGEEEQQIASELTVELSNGEVSRQAR